MLSRAVPKVAHRLYTQAMNASTAEIVASFSMDEMYLDQYFVSLLFYMGLLTIDRVEQGMTVLKIPNYSIRTIYGEYIELFIRNLNKGVMLDMIKENAGHESEYPCNL